MEIKLVNTVKVYNIILFTSDLFHMSNVCNNVENELLGIVWKNKLADRSIFVEKLGVTKEEIDYLMDRIYYAGYTAVGGFITPRQRSEKISDESRHSLVISYYFNGVTASRDEPIEYTFSARAFRTLYKACMLSVDIIPDWEYQTLIGIEKEDVLAIAKEMEKIIVLMDED